MIKIFLMLVIIIGCAKSSAPESTIREFENRLAKGEISNESLAMLMTENGFREYKKMKQSTNKSYLKKIEIIHSNCLEAVCSYTYDVSYKIKGNKLDSVMDVRKQAVLQLQDNNGWLIDELDIIKSYIDNKNPIKI